MRMNGTSRGLLLASAFFCASVPAGATTLTVDNPIFNPSFEDPIAGPANGGIRTGAAGWTFDTDYPDTSSGVWNIKDFPMGFWAASIPALKGNQVANLAPFSLTGGGLVQELTCAVCNLALDREYTLTGVVGVPAKEGSSILPPTPLPTYKISLSVGSTSLGSISGSGPERTLMDFTPLTVYGSDFPDLVGQPITIKLFSSGGQTAVDGLFLNVTVVPEPASVTLIALGVGLVAFKVRRRNELSMS